IEPEKILTSAYLRQWLVDAKERLSAGSVETYGIIIERRIIPAIGNIPLQKLRPAHVQAGHFSRYVLRVLKAALKSAVDLELVSRNVAVAIKPPVRSTAEVEILSPAQISDVLKALHGTMLFPIVSLALASGMRRGELLALRWQDISGTMVTVERSLEETVGAVRFKTPKTRAGRRTISIPESTVMMLAEHRRQQLEMRMRLGLGKPQPDALVFSNHEGEPIRADYVTAMWKRAVGGVKFHALRHTHASALIAAGIDVVTVSKRLGHASPALTLSVYSHLFSNTDAAAAAAVANLLAK
ncbi:MAG TPA: site-specific integrase, partial [Methyloceanibacter sp.]|nr:site-specific integrase [Methyloceanibacter sp.]